MISIKKHKITGSLISLAAMLLMDSCFSIKYDFKGGVSIPANIKTFSVQYFDNRAQLVEPTFSQRFTDALREYVESNTNLRYVRGIGDIDFSGTISTYKITPQAISSSGGKDVASMTRFTIGIKANYIDTKDQDNDFEKTVTGYRDFNSQTNFSSVEGDLADEIMDELVEQIFIAAFVNW
jgi:hypothetical protein